MRHAFLLTGYKNPQHIVRFMDRFDERFDFYIHIDRRSRFHEAAMTEIRKHPRCKLLSQEYVNRWGGIAHLLAMFHLARAALREGVYDYLHVQSGQDYPIKTPDAIDAFFQGTGGAELVKWFPFPSPNWGPTGGVERVRYFNFGAFLDLKKPRQSFIDRQLLQLQKRLGVNRRLPHTFPPLVGGSLWVSYTPRLWTHIISEWDRHPSWGRYFRFVFTPEELVLSSIALGSPYRDQVVQKGINDIDWSCRNGSQPANLDLSDFDRLAQSEFLFARKMEYPLSEALLDRIDRELLGVK